MFPRQSLEAERFMVMAVVPIAIVCHILALSSHLHEELQEQTRRNFHASALGLNDSGVEGWGVLFRAGGRWHEKLANET